jgi:hypothetical protein
MDELISGCCDNAHLTWVRRYATSVEPVVRCTHCGFELCPDGILLDWLDPAEIEREKLLQENMPYILDLAARMGLITWEGEVEDVEA